MPAFPCLWLLLFVLALGMAPAGAARAAGEAENSVGNLFRDRKMGVVFSTVSATRWDLHTGSGVKAALFSRRDEPGWRLMFTSGQKLRERDPLIVGRFSRLDQARLLLGREWHRDGVAITAMAGASLTILSPWEQAYTGYQARLGISGLVEWWKTWEAPSPLPAGFSSLTVFVDAAESSAFLRLRQGIDTGFRGLSLGPELALSIGNRRSFGRVVLRDSWFKTRIGLHATGFTIGRLRLQLAGGYEFRANERGSPYIEATSLWFY